MIIMKSHEGRKATYSKDYEKKLDTRILIKRNELLSHYSEWIYFGYFFIKRDKISHTVSLYAEN